MHKRACHSLRAFTCVLGPFSESLQSAFARVCVRSFACVRLRLQTPPFITPPFWKRLKDKNPEGANFRNLLRRKQSAAKISKTCRHTLNPNKSDIIYLLRNLLKYLPQTSFLSRSFQKFLLFAFCPLALFGLWRHPEIRGHQGNVGFGGIWISFSLSLWRATRLLILEGLVAVLNHAIPRPSKKGS